MDNSKQGYYWTNEQCTIQAKVNSAGLVSIVYKTDGKMHTNVATENRNYFKVYWDGDFPKIDGNSCGEGACTSLADGGCLCDIKLSEEAGE